MEGLHTGLSGIRANAGSLDQTANNLANVHTPGFQARRAELADGPGGQGAFQASTSRDTSPGPLLRSGRPFDLAIAGEGFFSVRRSDGSLGFTRGGSFQVDGEGRLATSSGDLVDPPIAIPPGATGVSISADGRVRAEVGGAQVDVGRIEVTRFPNAGGLSSVGGNLLVPTPASGPGARSFPGEGGAGSLVSGALEGSNVDIAGEIVRLIVDERAVQVNVVSVRTQDEIIGTILDLKR